MAKAPFLGKTGGVDLDPDVFEARFNEALVHECVRAEQNARRQGTASTKTRGKVRGGGAKPWRQKGTGRARAGSNRSPIWTGGGTVFGPSPRSYTFKINKKARRAALRSVLSLHAGRDSLAVVDLADYETPATKTAALALGKWGQPAPILVVLSESELEGGRSFRNLKRVTVKSVKATGVLDVIAAASLVMSEAALDALSSRAKGESAPGDVDEPVAAATEAVTAPKEEAA